ALLFDESDSAVVVVGLKIASFTYGGLLSLFILSRMPFIINRFSIILGLIISVAVVFILQDFGIAWTWFIGISVVINLLVVGFSNLILQKLYPGA
ncbi:MAG: sodium:solute symporter, partial [Fidelibacterota bacterium]